MDGRTVARFRGACCIDPFAAQTHVSSVIEPRVVAHCKNATPDVPYFDIVDDRSFRQSIRRQATASGSAR
ncbi:hypothetical protein [Burkholderia pseudomultivorans]|uniref:hypothetical protein n=1 Tax=Burkholderia pseudomultivorans TaxID=1207504 RepID=UPI000B32757B|nr:hypothetical protein [Burkholderia pseudomultivorans]